MNETGNGLINVEPTSIGTRVYASFETPNPVIVSETKEPLTSYDSNSGNRVWTNPDRGTISNNQRATVSVQNAAASNYLIWKNCGFAIPSNQTITGIVSVFERATTSITDAHDLEIRVVKGGAIGTTDRSTGTFWLNAVDRLDTYGSSSDLWGETWTQNDINSDTFGIALRVTRDAGTDGVARVDNNIITVYYKPTPTFSRWLPINLNGRLDRIEVNSNNNVSVALYNEYNVDVLKGVWTTGTLGTKIIFDTVSDSRVWTEGKHYLSITSVTDTQQSTGRVSIWMDSGR